jgi:hypothetical protein
MHVNGDEYVNSIKANEMRMSHMLLAYHLFGAVIELLENNGEEFNEENNEYILLYNATIIDPPTACGLLIGYIATHPDEKEYYLFNLAIRCIKTAEVKSSEENINKARILHSQMRSTK